MTDCAADPARRRLAAVGGQVPGSLWARAAILVLLLVVSVAAATTIDLPTLPDLRRWLGDPGPGTWSAMVVGLSLALLTPVPRSALSVLVGAVAGFPLGLAAVVLAGVVGGLAGYALSRWLGRSALLRVSGDRLSRVDAVLGRRGVLAVMTARALPMVPFVLVSYAAGLSAVRLVPYTVGTAVGVLPGSVLYVAVGASAAAWAAPWPITTLLIGLVAGVVLATAVWRMRRPATGA